MDVQETTLSERKAYAEPQLIEYGDLETLTRASGGEGNGADGQLQY